jgi:hypothetical protein
LIAVRGVLLTVHRALIGKGMIYSPSRGDNVFTVPLLDAFSSDNSLRIESKFTDTNRHDIPESEEP